MDLFFKQNVMQWYIWLNAVDEKIVQYLLRQQQP